MRVECPAKEDLAALVSGTLSEEAFAHTKHHLAGCRKCRMILAMVIKSETAVLNPTRVRRPHCSIIPSPD